MRVELQGKLELMTYNYFEAKKEFKWDMAILNHFIALSYASRNRRIEAKKIKEIRDFIKDTTGVFSKFRGNNLSLMSLLLSFEDNYKEVFKDIEEWTQKLKDKGISSYEYSPMIAYTILKNTSFDNREEKIERTKLFYEDMKRNHMFLTSKDDYVYAALLGCTDLDVKETTERIEYIYNKLSKMRYSKSNGLQTVSHVLALSEDFDYRISLFDHMVSELEEKKVKVKTYTLPSVALMALITDDANLICSEVSEIYEELKRMKGYKYGVQSYIKTMFSCILATSMYTEGENKMADISTGLSMQLIAVAQQQAMMAAASAAAASSAASSS
ncbi:DUF4003 family protein [Clostridium paridis]|uniref:DUF4003 family protein n=1 Tax=Clostridium paridis TaxID=2803863 RepID=A0A937FGQ8_9CLOT|nr:DUF4003 family protein [Clostridium paridis]MBL4933635.1 DUF4003 family protein [Clostridium paridis]